MTTEKELKKQIEKLTLDMPLLNTTELISKLKIINDEHIKKNIELARLEGELKGIQEQKEKEKKFINGMNLSIDMEIGEASKKNHPIAKQSILIYNMIKMFLNKKAKEILE